MANSPERLAAEPMAGFRTKYIIVFVHEFRANPLAVHVCAGRGMDRVYPDDQAGTLHFEGVFWIFRPEPVPEFPWHPRSEALNEEGGSSDAVLCAISHTFDLENPPVGQLQLLERAVRLKNGADQQEAGDKNEA